MKLCPKCSYMRTDKDDISTPDYECPKCGVIYSKVKQETPFKSVPPELPDIPSLPNESSALSIEEQEKICAEEKFRVEARAKAEREHKIAQDRKKNIQSEEQQKQGCIGCFSIFSVIFLISLIFSFCSEDTKNHSNSNNYNSYSSPTKSYNNDSSYWYEGGTLHYAKVDEWQNASYKNKIATASDWVASSKKGKSVFNETGDINSLKPYVMSLISCVDEASAGQGYGNMKIAEIAASCTLLMGYN